MNEIPPSSPSSVANSNAEAYQITALYQLTPIPEAEIDSFREAFRSICKSTSTVGSILVANEGMNGTVCTPREHAARFLEQLQATPFVNPQQVRFHFSYCSKPIFDRLRIRHKKEVVTMGLPSCCGPLSCRGTYVPPEQWNDVISDPNVFVVDTRNDYEVQIGTFKGAINPNITSFGEFPRWMEEHAKQNQQTLATPPRAVAMFCTGGIRCEKSTAFVMRELSQYFDQVYHLEGGILRYLEEIPPEKSLWEGECFVFDHRVAVTHGVKETGTYRWCVECKKRLSLPKGDVCAVCCAGEEGGKDQAEVEDVDAARTEEMKKMKDMLYYVRDHQ